MNTELGDKPPLIETPPIALHHMPFVSVIIPAYNEELAIEATFHRLQTVLFNLQVPYELIFVNDGSTDGTLEKLLNLSRIDSEIKIIDFSRNFGHQIAVTAGIHKAKGDVVVLIDADLQDPPELIRDFLLKWNEGYDVVYAVRSKRQGESRFKKWTARWFYRTLRGLTDIDIPIDTGDFRLMSRNVVNSLCSLNEHQPFVRGLVSWVGFRQIGVEYVRADRIAGESKYPLKKMVRLSVDGITSFSFKPLQLATKLGFLVAAFGFIGALIVIYMKLFTNLTVHGWTSLMIVTIFIGGIQLIMLGVVGEYISRIYDEVRRRPLYIVKNQYNFEAEHSENYKVLM